MDNAEKVVTYLEEQNSHLKDNCGTIYVSTENITTLKNLLIHSQKQKKLLKLYRKIRFITPFTSAWYKLSEQIDKSESELNDIKGYKVVEDVKS